MANIKSAKKRILVNETKRGNNLPKRSAMKSSVKKAINEEAEEPIREAHKRIDKALKHGIIKKNKAARLKSRIARNVKNK